MMIYAVYILSKDGIELISETFQSVDSIPNTTLLSALLVTFQQIAESVTKIGIPRKISFDELTYHLRSFGNIQVVVVTNSDKYPIKLISNIGFHFLHQFDIDYSLWDGNQTMFEPFRAIITKTITASSEGIKVDSGETIQPSKILTAREFINLPQKFQPIAYALNLESQSLDEMLEILNYNKEELIEGLRYLESKGYVGSMYLQGNNHYFTINSIRKN